MARPVTTFGGDLRFTPRHRYAPRTEAEVLEILDRHAGGQIRALGSLHSWSGAVASDDAVVDLRRFDTVEVEKTADGFRATVGAGCTVKRPLTEEADAAGRHTHHYPFFCRRVLPDDTLISMAAGETVWYSVSFFCYHGLEEIELAYPELLRFREICARTDPRGVFRNSFTRRVLGL